MRALLVSLLLVAVQAQAQTPIDSGLARYIAGIRAIDNHAHPMRPVAAGAPADTEYDALPLDGIPAFALPWRLTLDAPVWGQAARALNGMSTPAQALDRAGIAVEFRRIRIALGSGGSGSDQFRWVRFEAIR